MAKIFSGIQPTGIIHIGNYLGAIRNWVKLQDEHDCLFSIVDLHSLTIPYEPEKLNQRILDALATNIAAGLDPNKSSIFVQSMVPEHTELTWLLTTLTPVGNLERMTQYKEKSEKEGLLAGLLCYPILMAADILLYKAEVVPVGEDQLQHLELARVVARKFNSRFGEYFPEPQPALSEATRVMALNDPTCKMSKSIPGSYIALTDEPDEIRNKVKRAVTASDVDGKMSPGVQNLFVLLEVFGSKEIYDKFYADFENGTLKFSELKPALAECIVEELTPIREKRAELLAKPKLLEEIVDAGTMCAKKEASEHMKEIKELMGLNLRF